MPPSRAGGRSARGKLELCSDSHANTHMTVSLLLPCGQEWMKATPSRRPDIFPEFKPLKPQLPQPMPGDPEVPNDEEEADEKRQKVRVAARSGGRLPHTCTPWRRDSLARLLGWCAH